MDTLANNYYAVCIIKGDRQVRLLSNEQKGIVEMAKYTNSILDNDYLSFDYAIVYVRYSSNNLRKIKKFGFASVLSQFKLNLYNAFDFMLTHKNQCCDLFIHLFKE